MPDLDVILNRLRETRTWINPGRPPLVPLADAEVAVRDTRDATVKEIVTMLRDRDDFDPDERAWCNFAADLIARRFPNGGTHDG